MAIVNSPRRRASARNSATWGSGGPWEIPSAMSSGRARGANRVAPLGSLLGAIAGRARLPTMTGCMNSTAACAASVAAGPVPKGISVPPREKARAIAWQALEMFAASRSTSSRTTRSRSSTRSSSSAHPIELVTPSAIRSLEAAGPELRQLLLVGLAEHLQKLARLPGLVLVDLRHREADVDQDPVAQTDRILTLGEQADVDIAPHA